MLAPSSGERGKLLPKTFSRFNKQIVKYLSVCNQILLITHSKSFLGYFVFFQIIKLTI
jgi:hypothetical protein